MTRNPPNPPPATSRGLSAISSLSNAEKARLFDHLQTAHANVVASRPSTEPISASSEADDPTVYLSSVYSAVVHTTRTVKHADDLVLDTGADQFILKDEKLFLNMTPIEPVPIKTANGDCHLMATHRGDAEVESYDDDGRLCTMMMPDLLYCKGITVNLISAIRLCDLGC